MDLTATYHALTKRVGNTPVVYYGTYKGVDIWIKIEALNPSWSLKDRATWRLLQNALERKLIEPGVSTIIDTSSGSFSRSIALFGRALSCNVEVVLKQDIDSSYLEYMQIMGATPILHNIKNSTEGRDIANNIATLHDHYVFLDQMGSIQAGLAHYETTGPEIALATEEFQAAVISMGSGATVWGVGKYFQEKHPHMKLVASTSGDTANGKFAGMYAQGDFYSKFIEDIRNQNLAFEISVDYDNGIERAKDLVYAGFNVGATTGGVLEAAIKTIDVGHITDGPIVILAGDGSFPNMQKIFG